MAFLFKSKKSGPPPSSMTNATRNIHTSDGTSGTSKQGSIDNTYEKAQSPPPNAGPNGSIGSLNGASGQPQNATNAPGPFVRSRDRADSEAAPRTGNMRQAPPHSDLYPWSQKTLTFQNAQANPFPRYGAAVNAIASREGDIYLMGGLINGSMVRGDLWMVEAGSMALSCYPIASVSEGPGPRVGHASLLVGNAFIVFGGDTKMDESDILDDTLYLLNTSSRLWSRASPPGQKPAGRYGHTLNILGSKIYIFGGQVEGSFYNDLIAFDLNNLQNPSNQWDFLVDNTEEDHVPPARTNHTMISFNDQLYLFGGTDGNQWFNDVWTFDPKTNKWTQQDCIGYIPAPREGHSAALVNDVMYIFGGRTENGDDLGDLAAFRISLRRWYTFQNMGPSPSPRSGHSMTAFGKQIFVLAGEPSTAPRDPSELSMIYVLDTAKIRYPNDNPSSQQKQLDNALTSGRQNVDPSKAIGGPRSSSREGHVVPSSNATRDAVTGGPVQRPEQQQQQPNRPVRSSVAQAASPPPMQNQVSDSRPNGMISPTQQQPRSRSAQGPGTINEARSPPPHSGEHTRQSASDANVQTAAVRDPQKDNVKAIREASPASSHGRRTPTHQSVAKAKAMEAGEAAPLVGASVARQRSLRSQRAHGSIDSTEDGALGRSGSRSLSDHRNSKSFAEEPNSPKITPHQEALMKELESVKSKNAWYASELALARKAGYAGSSSPTIDDRATMQFSDDDRPLVEAFMTMRNELTKMQQSMEQQSSITAKKIAEVEHQRDAAVTEAAYARAKLAAHGGSQRSTPQLDSVREGDDADRSTDISRRLALSLAATNEHKAKIESINDELAGERRAREAAEEAAEAAQRRLDELKNRHNPGEIEALRAELHETQSFARSEAGLRADLEQKLRLLEFDHKDLTERHGSVAGQISQHASSFASLEAALAASTSKTSVYERQLDAEREQRENLQRKIAHLRSEHEERTMELETTQRRLRDAEALAETHAKEASTHREALVAGLSKISRPDSALARDTYTDERVATLQEIADRSSALAKSNQDAAENAAQKLRSAEERIAGLEAYQEQSSREGLQIRRQLQAALKDLKSHQNENRELRTHLESHQRDASALAVQHGALKDLLGERGIDISSSRRSPTSEHGSRYGTPEQGRARDIEAQLQASHRAHEDTKAMYESREQEAERAYRERLEQLENDYQSLLTYVRGTERMLKKMKEELTKYKTANQRLTSEVETVRDGTRSAASTHTDATEWANERDALQNSINDVKSLMAQQIQTLEANMNSVQKELATAQAERDHQKANHDELSKSMAQREKELSQLRSENSMLETRALDAEHRVTMLLDQVGSSVNNYRRQSQMHSGVANGVTSGHNREASSASTITDTSSHEEDGDDTRGSTALDHLASELETLRSQWENQSRSYRISSRFDFERNLTHETSGTADASGSHH